MQGLVLTVKTALSVPVVVINRVASRLYCSAKTGANGSFGSFTAHQAAPDARLVTPAQCAQRQRLRGFQPARHPARISAGSGNGRCPSPQICLCHALTQLPRGAVPSANSMAEIPLVFRSLALMWEMAASWKIALRTINCTFRWRSVRLNFRPLNSGAPRVKATQNDQGIALNQIIN